MNFRIILPVFFRIILPDYKGTTEKIIVTIQLIATVIKEMYDKGERSSEELKRYSTSKANQPL